MRAALKFCCLPELYAKQKFGSGSSKVDSIMRQQNLVPVVPEVSDTCRGVKIDSLIVNKIGILVKYFKFYFALH